MGRRGSWVRGFFEEEVKEFKGLDWYRVLFQERCSYFRGIC